MRTGVLACVLVASCGGGNSGSGRSGGGGYPGVANDLATASTDLAAGGGAGFALSKRAQEARIEREKKEAELLAAKAKAEEAAADFLKGIEITLKVDPPAPKPPGQSGSNETLDQRVVAGVMNKNFKVLVGCILDERRRNLSLRNVDIDFIIKGTGNVSAVRVNGQTSGPFAVCILGEMQTVAFPKFNGAKTRASINVTMK